MLQQLGQNCTGCFACYNVCPQNCITMSRDYEGFLYPQINKEICVECGFCEKTCPVLSSPKEGADNSVAFAAKNKSEEQRLNSSSGGIFTLLAEQIISEGGVVCGAAVSEDCKEVHHIIVDNLVDLEKLCGSKYVQSKVGDTFKEVCQLLKDGTKVLYSGTPCQIAGLYSCCNKNTDLLYTCDIICHGVPSPMVWEEYVSLRECVAQSKAKSVSFRDKSFSWSGYSLKIDFEDGTQYKQSNGKDRFLRGFISSVFLRPSCYDCSFKGLNRKSDITLADFWGVDNIAPSMNDKKGTSLIIVNTEKGREIFDLLDSRVDKMEVDVYRAVQYNSAAEKSVPMPQKKRSAFFRDFHSMSVKKAMEKHCSPKLSERLRRKIGRVLRKLKKYRGA